MKFKNLERFRTGGTSSKMELSVPLPRTPNGRVYRFSPNEAAHPRHFLIGEYDENFVISTVAQTRMKLHPRSKETVCPYSGVIAADAEFTHPDDVKAAREIVQHAAAADVQAALRDAFAGLNRGSSGGLFQLKIETKSTPKPRPRFYREDLLRELVCDHCGRDYAVYAIALFCPDCGAPNLRLHFAREADLIRTQVTLAEGQAEHSNELAYRLLGNAHEDVLTAFEATLKTVYLHAATQCSAAGRKGVKNDFQNVEIAQRRFAEFGLDPFDCLQPDQLEALKLNIQKRHLIGHNLGVVDAKFAEHAEDARVGETIHLVGEDIRQFADFSQLVVDRLDAWLGTSCPSELTRETPHAAKADQVTAAKAAKVPGPSDLSETARRLGAYIAEQSKEGMVAYPIRGRAVAAAFADVTSSELAEAIAELESDGFASTSLSGTELPDIRPTLDLYATFDPIALGSDPLGDALALTAMVLEETGSIPLAQLHAKTGWSQRRFNPAAGLVIAQVDDQHVSRTMEPNYPAHWFRVDASDRVALKRFAARLERRS